MIYKQLVAENFSQSSSEYESVALCQSYAAVRFAGMIADRFGNRESALRILEIGCGTGFLTKMLIGLFPHAQIMVCDISEEMLSVCKGNTAAVRKHHGLEVVFEQCDIATDPLDVEYDLVVSGMAFQWLEHSLGGIVTKIRQHLSEGGMLMFSTLLDKTFWRLRAAFSECGVEFPGPVLLSREELEAAAGGRFEVSTEVYKDYYPSVLSFLEQLKATGAVNATGQPVSPGALRKVIRTYSESCPTGDVLAEYHLAYCFLS